MNRRECLKLLGIAVAGLDGFTLAQPVDPLRGLNATVYKSPACGCCGGYVDFLKSLGVRTTVVMQNDLAPLKARYRIPPEAQSCHTVLMGGYVVEGHVPHEALVKLFRERPRIDGIALPGMPGGTPGMPGPKTQPYRIVRLLKGQVKPYLSL